MALAASALVSLSEARDYLGVSDSDLPTDALLELVIEGLSTHIEKRTGQVYVNPIADDGESTRAYSFSTGERTVRIDNVRSLSKVEVTGTPQDTDSWLELTDTDYIAEPPAAVVQDRIRFLLAQEMPAAGVGWSALALHRSGENRDSMATPWPWEARSAIDARVVVRVTGKYGLGAKADAVPAHVRLATLMWLQNIHKRDQAFFSDTIGVASALTRIPPDVAELLGDEESDRAQVVAV